MGNHSRHFSFDADENLIDYLIDEVIETSQQWPDDNITFNENWVDSHISEVWIDFWTSMTKEQQSEMMDYVDSYVSEYMTV